MSREALKAGITTVTRGCRSGASTRIRILGVHSARSTCKQCQRRRPRPLQRCYGDFIPEAAYAFDLGFDLVAIVEVGRRIAPEPHALRGSGRDEIAWLDRHAAR